MDQLAQFIDQLIKDKHLPTTDEKVLAELKADLTQRLVDQIDRAAIEALPEEKAIELAEKLDDPNFGAEQTTAFLKESGVEFEQVVANTMVAFRRMYLGEEIYGE